MEVNMDKELQELIDNFNKKFAEAQDARAEVMDYLEEKYDIDTNENWEELENDYEWCYGIDIDGIEYLINEVTNGITEI